MAVCFVTEPDESLKCLICLEVAKDPWQHDKCGRLFCRRCLDKHGRSKPCPTCRMKRALYFEDSRSKRDIQFLSVKCNCEWLGTRGALKEHLSTCEFTLVSCPNKCRESEIPRVRKYMRKDMGDHLANSCPNRDYTCEHCSMEGRHSFITQFHDKVCKKKVIPCPSIGCTQTSQRCGMKRHIQTCGFSEVTCKYQRLGCEVQTMRCHMPEHEESEDTAHFRMALEKITSYEKATLEAKAEFKTTFKMTEFHKKKADQIMSTRHFHPNSYEYDISVYLSTDYDMGKYLSVYASVRNEDAPVVGKITFKLLNQLEDKNHHELTSNIDEQENAETDGDCIYCDEFIPISALGHDPVKNTQYLKDDTLYFNLIVNSSAHKPWLECSSRSTSPELSPDNSSATPSCISWSPC